MGKRSCLNQILHLKLNLNIELNAYQNFIDWKSTMSFCHVCAMPADEVRLLPSACEICIESGTKCLSIFGLGLPCHPGSVLSYSTFLPLFSNIFYLCYPLSLYYIFLFHISIDFLLKF